MDTGFFKVREGGANDLPFVIDSWSQSYYGAKAVAGMQKDDYFPAMHSKVKDILARPGVVLVVACASEDDDTILGWAAFEDRCLHYVVVKKDVRGVGIAKALVPDSITMYSYKSARIEKIPNGWKYRPDMVW